VDHIVEMEIVMEMKLQEVATQIVVTKDLLVNQVAVVELVVMMVVEIFADLVYYLQHVVQVDNAQLHAHQVVQENNVEIMAVEEVVEHVMVAQLVYQMLV
jgi:hypothetical protein